MIVSTADARRPVRLRLQPRTRRRRSPVAYMSTPEPIAVSIAVDSVGPRAIVRLLRQPITSAADEPVLQRDVLRRPGPRRSTAGSPVVVSRAGHAHYRIVVDDLAPGEYVFTTCAAAKNGIDAVASDIFSIRTFASRCSDQPQPSAAGSVADQAARSSSSGMPKWPSTTSWSPPVRPSSPTGTPRLPAMVGERLEPLLGHGDDRARGRLGEQPHEGVALEPDGHADVAAQARLDQGLGEPAVGQVVGRGQQARAAGVDQQPGEVALVGEVDPRRRAAEVAVHDVRPLRARQLLAGLAEVQHQLAAGDEAGGRALGDVVDDAEHGHDRRRQDRRLARSGCRG